MNTVVYEDPWTQIIVPGESAVAGQVQVVSKLPAKTLAELNDEQVEHLFFVASYAGTAVFELLGVQGTNMVLTEGDGPLVIDILARKADDGLDILWSPSQLSQTELQSSAKSIRDAIDILLWHENNPQESTPQQPASEVPTPATAPESVPTGPSSADKPPKENYMIKHLRRVP